MDAASRRYCAACWQTLRSLGRATIDRRKTTGRDSATAGDVGLTRRTRHSAQNRMSYGAQAAMAHLLAAGEV